MWPVCGSLRTPKRPIRGGGLIGYGPLLPKTLGKNPYLLFALPGPDWPIEKGDSYRGRGHDMHPSYLHDMCWQKSTLRILRPLPQPAKLRFFDHAPANLLKAPYQTGKPHLYRATSHRPIDTMTHGYQCPQKREATPPPQHSADSTDVWVQQYSVLVCGFSRAVQYTRKCRSPPPPRVIVTTNKVRVTGGTYTYVNPPPPRSFSEARHKT